MPPVVGNSLNSLATQVAREVGPYYQPVLTSLGASGTQAVSAQLIDSEAPAERYGGYYLFSHGPSVVNEQHRVTRAGFSGATGALTVNGSFSAQPAPGTTMSLLGTIPMISQDGLLGLRECVNRALRKLWVRYRIALVSTGPNVLRYDLGARWWMARKRVIRLLGPASVDGHATPAGIGYDVVQNGELWTLELGSGFPEGETFWLDVEAPANSRLYTGSTGVWTDQASPTAGLTFDQDACVGDANALLHGCLYETIKALAVQAGGARKSYWREREAEQRVIVSAIKLYELDAEPETLGEDMTTAPSGYLWGLKGLNWR